jgi:hypothetical protein
MTNQCRLVKELVFNPALCSPHPKPAIFNAIGPLADSQNGDDFFKKYYAAYFYKLGQSANMPAFARLVSQSTPESVEWVKNNAPAMTSLEDWVKSTERGF